MQIHFLSVLQSAIFSSCLLFFFSCVNLPQNQIHFNVFHRSSHSFFHFHNVVCSPVSRTRSVKLCDSVERKMLSACWKRMSKSKKCTFTGDVQGTMSNCVRRDSGRHLRGYSGACCVIRYFSLGRTSPGRKNPLHGKDVTHF